MGFTAYMGRRLLLLVPVVVGILVLTFMIKAAIPTDVVSQMYMGRVTDEQAQEAMANIRAKFHLDQPMQVQFYYYMIGLLHGDLGISVRTRRPVSEEIGFRYVNTLKLTLASLLIGIVVGVGTGIVSAYYKDSFVDSLAMVVGLFGLSMPAFFFGIILILLFAVKLRWLPVLGTGGIKDLILPSLNLGLILAASLSRISRSSMLEVLNQDYIRAARAKGVRERAVVLKHALRNALIPVITVIGLQIGGLLGGAFIIENVFAWHGIGELGVNAIQWKDFTITQAIILVTAITYVVVNLFVDVVYQVVDPRIRLSG